MLDGRYRFENFVVGASNRLAVSAARSIVEQPVSGGQHLILRGPSGVGKTHLLAALGFEIQQRHPNLSVGYLAVEPLIEELHAAIATGQVDLVLTDYCQWNVLLLDDVHQLSARFETQYELLRVFSAFREPRHRIVYTSDRALPDIGDLDERVRAQMGPAAVVDLDVPSYELRVAVVEAACRDRKLAADAPTIERLAGASTSSLHPLLAAVERLAERAAPSPKPAKQKSAPRSGILTPAFVEFPAEVSDVAPDFGLEPVEAPSDVPVQEPAKPPPTPPKKPGASKAAPPKVPASAASKAAPPKAPAAAPPEAPPSGTPKAPTSAPPRTAPTPPLSRATPSPPPDEFENFVGEVTAAVSMSVDRWRARLVEAAKGWAAEGFRTEMIERALKTASAADLSALEVRFALAVDRLRVLEGEAARLDPKLAGLQVFRDPEHVTKAETVLLRAFAAFDPPSPPDPRLTIETFIAGEKNQRAFRAAAEVIALPGSRSNPLVLYGPAGAGKSHLLHAIGNALLMRDGARLTVGVCRAATFTAELRDARRDGTIERWRTRHRCADALLIDDIQQLAADVRAQEELEQLMRALIGAKKQIVVAAAAPLAALTALSPALRQHLEAGVAVEIGRVPEAERVARHTPVPDGAEAAAPTIDTWFDEASDSAPTPAHAPLGGGVDSFFLDPEKCVTDWPGVDGRVSEDPR